MIKFEDLSEEDWESVEEGELTTNMLLYMRETYGPTEIPPCHICGAPLSMQKVGGGEPTVWACTGKVYDEEDNYIGMAEGRSPADEHYSKSEFIDRKQGGDERVVLLIDAELKRRENK